ncbi:NAD(P)H-dependent oxidoreductase [Amycolatopsis regifaucium]|uniref:NADPH:quinone reductase n=1 Tax=Amycolatopsis regifaucium TaxID=546365 RepID=A0A154MCJ5_9PSEU|nr:NAD(P)H-dependent oxidoreductase [Amycolatopsis regifaucium]KZB82271.1 NADPH:quinone reductase [Amycolatopsis regifaucium]OKA05657.1 NADPH:quinone reductase [Amycolatopsis regifaucium]SFG88225.1 NAD(P)H dehydrogenase (quinone) [Amycolatopsis regifaucium]
MNVLWIFAHPEPRSLGGSLRDEGVRALREQGANVRESDLYAMKWKPVVDTDDFGSAAGSDRLIVGATSKDAFTSGELSEDIRAEHEKLAWADAVIIQFPLWWYGMPAILKGWFDRVFVKGFAYGVQRPDGKTARYGEGKLAGKRAMVLLTAGAPEATIGPRGVNGEINDLLFPLQHGTLWYAGMSVLPPLTIHGADRVSPGQYDVAVEALRDRLRTLATSDPIPFRSQNGGDYDEDLVLRDHLAPGRSGIGVHTS